MDKIVINQLPIDSLRGKRVFVRIDVDIDEPSVALPIDEHKLRASLTTLEFLASMGARTVIGTHLGNPDGMPIDELRVDPVAQRLSLLTGKTARKLDEAIGRNVLLERSAGNLGDRAVCGGHAGSGAGADRTGLAALSANRGLRRQPGARYSQL
jgi:3-phosphoglycerate kinase